MVTWGRIKMMISERVLMLLAAILRMYILMHDPVVMKGSHALAIGWHDQISTKELTK